MNYEVESKRLCAELADVLRRKYRSDNYDEKKAEIAITRVCYVNKYPKNEKSNYIYFSHLLEVVNSKIKRGVLSCEIFSSIYTISTDTKKRIRSKELTTEVVEGYKHSKFDQKTKECIKLIIDSLNDEDYSREDLERFESNLTEYSKHAYNYYSKKDSRGKIMGSLNKGFYGMSITNLDKYIKNHGVQSSKSDRFISVMSDDVLKYRIALLYISNAYSRKGFNEKTSYGDIREKNRRLGSIARSMFAEEFGLFPEQSILNVSSNIKGKSKVRTK